MTREEKIIDELCRLLSDYERNQPREEAQKERYRWAVKEVTKALQEQKVGKWIPVTNGRGGSECNQCHSYAPSYQSGNENKSNYCPNCGARMVTDDE